MTRESPSAIRLALRDENAAEMEQFGDECTLMSRMRTL